MNDVLKQMLNDIDVGLKNALIRVNELVAENKALKEALAQDDLCSSQEPWMYRIWNDKDAQWRLTDDCSWPAEPIYTTPPNPKSQPEQKPVAWKLVPRDPTDEMLKAMDECSTEGYDERLCAGHAASVYMAAWDEAPTPPQPEQEPTTGNILMDSYKAMQAKKLTAQPEQEPVAWIHNFIEGGISIGKRPLDLTRHPDRWTALYRESKPCPTCEALARTVMLDQTSHDTKRPWVGLTAQEAADCWTTSATKTWHNFEAALRSKNI